MYVSVTQLRSGNAKKMSRVSAWCNEETVLICYPHTLPFQSWYMGFWGILTLFVVGLKIHVKWRGEGCTTATPLDANLRVFG